MSAAAGPGVVEHDVVISIPLAIAKGGVDASRRTVRGLMTQECVDAHGEEVDFESVKSCLSAWRGNVREMHQPVAVGRAVDIVVHDATKAVEVESYVSRGAEDTWQKCLDGTLGFYSLGGIADRVYGDRSDGTRGPRLIMKRIGELSLVDSGACPTSSISVVKMVDGQPVAQVDEPDPAVVVKTSDTGGVTSPETSAPAPALAMAILKGMGFRSERWNINNALTVLSLLEELVTEQCFETCYSAESPDNAAQVELLRLAVAILIDFIATEFEQQFSDGDALTKLGDEAVAKAITAAIEKKGARHSKGDVQMIQSMHDNVVKLGAACGVEKMTTTTTTTPAAPETPAAPAAAAPAPTTAVVEKAGDVPAADPTPAPVPVDGQPVPDLETIVRKAVSTAIDGIKVTFDTQVAELKAASDATIAKLQDQVTKLSAEPAAGGPVASAHAVVVEKSGAGVGDLLADKTVAERVIAQLEDVAKAETDPHARQSLVEKALSLRMQHGIGAVHVPITSSQR